MPRFMRLRIPVSLVAQRELGRPSCNLLGARTSVAIVGQIQVSLSTLGRQDDHANDTTRASVPFDGLPQRPLDERNALFLAHAFLPVGVAVSVDVRRSRACNSVRLFVQGAAEGYRVYLAAMSLVPACDDDTGAEAAVLVKAH